MSGQFNSPSLGSVLSSVTSAAESQEPVEITLRCCLVVPATGDVIERPYPELSGQPNVFYALHTARGLIDVLCADFYLESHALLFVAALEQQLREQGVNVINRVVN
jgi:hypothetical protein